VTVRALVFLIVLVLPACRGLDDPGAAVGVFYPRHFLSGPHTLAPLEGRLEVKDGCLWVVKPDGMRFLPIWPGGYGLRRADGRLQVTDSAGRVVGAEGETLTLVGGQYPTNDARKIMGREEPRACRAGFWLVGSVTAGAGRSSIP
jgi:hypothetical protein